MKNAFTGFLIGFLSVMIIKPEVLVNQRLKAKLHAIEYVLIDQEIELNKIKKQLNKKENK